MHVESNYLLWKWVERPYRADAIIKNRELMSRKMVRSFVMLGSWPSDRLSGLCQHKDEITTKCLQVHPNHLWSYIMIDPDYNGSSPAEISVTNRYDDIIYFPQ